jgi:hypothetical protein
VRGGRLRGGVVDEGEVGFVGLGEWVRVRGESFVVSHLLSYFGRRLQVMVGSFFL